MSTCIYTTKLLTHRVLTAATISNSHQSYLQSQVWKTTIERQIYQNFKMIPMTDSRGKMFFFHENTNIEHSCKEWQTMKAVELTNRRDSCIRCTTFWSTNKWLICHWWWHYRVTHFACVLCHHKLTRYIFIHSPSRSLRHTHKNLCILTHTHTCTLRYRLSVIHLCASSCTLPHTSCHTISVGQTVLAVRYCWPKSLHCNVTRCQRQCQWNTVDRPYISHGANIGNDWLKRRVFTQVCCDCRCHVLLVKVSTWQVELDHLGWQTCTENSH